MGVSKTWSHRLREEHRLRADEYKVLRRISVRKRNEVKEGWMEKIT
jgi:hypothetical protein